MYKRRRGVPAEARQRIISLFFSYSDFTVLFCEKTQNACPLNRAAQG